MTDLEGLGGNTYIVSATRTKPAYEARHPLLVAGKWMNRATRRFNKGKDPSTWVQR